MVVLFLLDLSEIFFLPTVGFETATSGSLFLPSTTASWQLLVFHLWQFQVFNSGAEGLVGGTVLIGSVRDLLFSTMLFETGTSGSLILPSTTASWQLLVFHLWQFQVFNSGAEGLVVVLFWLDLWEIFFLPSLEFETGTSGSLVLHSTTVPQWLLVFYLWQFQVFNSGAEGLVGVLSWLGLWEIYFFSTMLFELGTSGSLVLHCTTVPWQHLIFHVSQFQVSNSGAQGLMVVLFW